MKGIGGLNSRVEDTSPGECYLTPRWAVEFLLKHWCPMGEVICDPCACGFAGWSIGTMVAENEGLNLDTELSDIDPLHESVIRADFRTLKLPDRRRTIATNPPYNLMAEFVRWALMYADEVVVLMRFGFLCAEGGARAMNLAEYIQPAKRLAFELLPEEGRRREAWNMANPKEKPLDVNRDPSTLTGYRMSSTGVDHGWAVYRRGYAGQVNLVIARVESNPLQGRLF